MNLISLIKSQFQHYIDYEGKVSPAVTDARKTYTTKKGNLVCDFTDDDKLGLLYAGEKPNELKLSRMGWLESEISDLYDEKKKAKHGEKGTIQSRIDSVKSVLKALQKELFVNNNKKRASLIVKRLKHACETISENETYHFEIAYLWGRIYVYDKTHWKILPIEQEEDFTAFLIKEVGPSVGEYEANFTSSKALIENIESCKILLNKTWFINKKETTGKIAFKDCTYDFFTKNTSKHNPQDFITHYIDVNFKDVENLPDVTIDFIRQKTKGLKHIIDGAFTDFNCFIIICEQIALALSQTTRNPKLVMMKGPTKTGKSKLLYAFKDWMPELVHEIKLEYMFHKQGYTRGQQLKRAGTKPIFIAPEAPREPVDATSYKTTVRQENVTMELKGKDEVPHPSNFRILAASNHSLNFKEGGEQIDDRQIVIPTEKLYDRKDNSKLTELLQMDRNIGTLIVLKLGLPIFNREHLEFTESAVVENAKKDIQGSLIKSFIDYLGIRYEADRPTYHINKKLFGHMLKEFKNICSHRYFGTDDDARNEIALSFQQQTIDAKYTDKKKFQGKVTSDYLHIDFDPAKLGRLKQMYEACIRVEKKRLGYAERLDNDGQLIEAEIDVWKDLRFPDLDIHTKVRSIKKEEENEEEEIKTEDTLKLDPFAKSIKEICKNFNENDAFSDTKGRKTQGEINENHGKIPF